MSHPDSAVCLAVRSLPKLAKTANIQELQPLEPNQRRDFDFLSDWIY